jgi:hypothetical protein
MKEDVLKNVLMIQLLIIQIKHVKRNQFAPLKIAENVQMKLLAKPVKMVILNMEIHVIQNVPKDIVLIE